MICDDLTDPSELRFTIEYFLKNMSGSLSNHLLIIYETNSST